ncbi:MAG TPA: lipase secretion chaperone [Telluria sp.]|jgi:lipase chaperone LimK
MNIKGALAGIAAVLIAGVVLYRAPANDAPVTPVTPEQRTERAVERSLTLLAETSAGFGALPQQPAPQPAFRLGADGKLAIDERTSILLDVLLTSLPRHPDRAEMDQLEKDLAAGLPPDAARELAHLLRNYVAYRELETELAERQRADAALTPDQALDQLHALRTGHFGERLAASLYGKEEKQMRADLAATRPGAPEQAAAAADPALERLRDGVAALRKTGAPEAQVAALRLQVLGPERAQQLQDTEQVQADWEQRSAAFLAAARPGTDMESLLRGLYSEQEMPAARAYNLARLRSEQAGAAR